MNTHLTSEKGEVQTRPELPVTLGLEMNRAAERAVFQIYQARRPKNTQKAQQAALTIFAEFMRTLWFSSGDLYSDPFSWMGITWGMVQAFQAWLLKQGYSVKTVNDRVSTVKVYMALANQAGIIPDGEILRLQRVKGFSRKEAHDQDAKRTQEGLSTRRGTKKSTATQLTEDQARALCRVRNDSPQARRDALLMCLLLDHGLRVSEVEILSIEDIDLQARQMTFYRPKTGSTSRHNLRGRTWAILTEYLGRDNQAMSGPLILPSCKSGVLVPGKRMTRRAIQDRVKNMGMGLGVPKLSPHDLRHWGATKAGKDPTVSLAGLMQWGGWGSAASASRYLDRGRADNEGVSLGMD